jgi:predicted permease
MRELLVRLRDWLRRDRLERELTDELAFHRQHLEADARARGLDPEAAARAARRRLGNLPRTQEAARERWSVPWLEHLLHDARYALRGLRRSPGFTLGAVITLGLGIGANAAMFGVIDRLMFRPHPYLTDPGTVHRVYLRYRFRDQEFTVDNFEYARYLDFRRWSTAFSGYASFFPYTEAVGVGEAARERRIAAVSASFWDFFQARAARGRYFGPAQDRTPRGEPVAVLSHEFWMAEFGGQDVLGQTLQVGSIPCTIIGVTPKGFVGVFEDDPPAVYLPITTYAGSRPDDDGREYFVNYNWGWMEMMVRRKPGVSRDAATADLTSAFVRSWRQQRDLDPDHTWPVELARPRAIPGAVKQAAGLTAGLESRTLLWVTGVAVVVLLIACANVANLVLARALKRRKEVALRLALGVSRGRLIAQSLTESLTLSALGCLVGLALAQWGGLALRRLFLGAVSWLDLLTDARTLAVALGAAVVAALITGLLPVLVASGSDVGPTLKAGVREGTYQRSRARTAMLVAQGALSVVLLVGAALFVRSLSHVRNLPLGFDPQPVLFASQNLRGTRLTEEEQIALGRRLLVTGQTLPEVERAAWVSSVPWWSTSTTSLFVAGIDSVRRLGSFTYQTATRDYFAAMGTRVLRGRGFEPGDRAGAPLIAVVSESMARVLWPGREAIGQCMRVGADTMPCTTVVGIAEDAWQRGNLTDAQPFRYYLPLEQYRPVRGFALMLRMRGDPGQSVEPVRRALQAVMPGQSYVTVRPFREIIDARRRSWRVGAAMFVAFGGLALLVSAVGLYGVIAYNVAQRLHEVGVRIALGAGVGDVLRLIMGQGIRFALAGVVLGVGLALLASRWVQPLLFRQSARDPAVYALVGAMLLLVAVLASSIPALRATRADPNAALRAE